MPCFYEKSLTLTLKNIWLVNDFQQTLLTSLLLAYKAEKAKTNNTKPETAWATGWEVFLLKQTTRNPRVSPNMESFQFFRWTSPRASYVPKTTLVPRTSTSVKFTLWALIKHAKMPIQLLNYKHYIHYSVSVFGRRILRW